MPVGTDRAARAERAGRRVARGLLVLLVLLAPRAASAYDLSGGARFVWTDSDADGLQYGTTDRSLQLFVAHAFTPYLRLQVGGTYGDLTSSVENDEVFSRTNRQPRVSLLYSRPTLSAGITYEENLVEGLAADDRFESESVRGNLSWEAGPGLRFLLQLSDSSNRNELEQLGRGVDERRARFEVVYDRTHWGVVYSGAFNELEREATGLRLEQMRHEVRLNAGRTVLDGRLRVGFSGLAGVVDAEEKGSGESLGEPLAALDGLFAIDPSPGIGELESAPGLADGDLDPPSAAPVEIGGAATFRNVGVDLGLPLPATRMAIYVDRPSDPGLVWEVYESFDNLFWEPVLGVTTAFDSALLRYELRFPRTSGRYLKALNVSINGAESVRVTEVVALREVESISGAEDRSSDLYRLGVNLGWKVSSRVRFSADAQSTNDRSAFAGVTQRDYRSSAAQTGVQVDLSDELKLGVRVSWTESDELGSRDLYRTSRGASASLRWTPLPTVDAVILSSVREDADESATLSSLASTRAQVDLQLLADLRLVSDFTYSRFESDLLENGRNSWQWSQRVETTPLRGWRLGVGYAWARTESAGTGAELLDRTSAFVRTDWSPGSALSLNGTLYLFDDVEGRRLRQSYGLSWTPGPKLSIALGWRDDGGQLGRSTRDSTATINYRVASRLTTYASATRSEAELGVGERRVTDSVQFGTTISF